MAATTRKLSNTKGASNEGSFTLILPKEWCDENNLNHGDELELILDKIAPGSILIQLPQNEILENNTELILDDREHKTPQARRRAILGGYLEGYDTIKLIHVSRKSSERLKIREDIQELTQKLDGCSTNEEERKFELTIASGLRSPIELLEKLYSTTKLMFEDVFRAYLNYDQDLSRDLIQRDDQADKLYFSIVRTLKLILREPFKVSGEQFQLVDTLDYRMVASNLENLCDACEFVAESIVGLNDKEKNIAKKEVEGLQKNVQKQIDTISKELIMALEDSYEYYKESNEERAVVMSARKPEMDQYITQLRDLNVHTSLLDVLEEAKETIVDLLELVHANPEELE